MKRFVVDHDPRPLKRTDCFKRFNKDLGVKKFEELDQYSEYYFIRKIQQQNDIYYLCELIRYHFGFIISVARQSRTVYVPFDDLISECCIGFINASFRFDYKRGHKFLSYAVWYMRGSMIKSIADNYELIRLPINQYDLLFKMRNTIESLNNQYGVDFTNKHEEIAEILEVPTSRVEDLMNSPLRENIVSFDDVYESFINPDTLMETNLTVKDVFVFDLDGCTYDDGLRGESLRKEVMRSLDTITQRESEIVRLFFGIGITIKNGLIVSSEDCKEGCLLEEIGEHFNLTTERTRQIKEKAIRRLRHTSRSKLLKSYLG
ncbi:MAG: sigma-70 family RNA polymerase sigma factor [Candidatus Paceibacterota bacterium]